MTDLETLRTLLDRVEHATEGTDDLDEAIWRALEPHLTGVPGYTSSIDAAVALIKRVLPEANCHGYGEDPRIILAYVSRNHVKSGHWLVEAVHKTSIPLALLAALLKALINRAEAQTEGGA